jgi:hypothetical protein
LEYLNITDNRGVQYGLLRNTDINERIFNLEFFSYASGIYFNTVISKKELEVRKVIVR